MPEKRVFTEEEIDYILDNWGKMSVRAMARSLHVSRDTLARIAKELNRTTKSVEQKAESLGLRKRKKRNTSN